MKKQLYASLILENAIHTLKSITQIPSVSKNEQKLAVFLKEKCTSMGMDCVIDPHGNMIARKKYTDDGVRFCLNSHMDTVDIYDGWSTDPYACVMDGTVMYGVGALDCKAAMAGMLMALETILKNEVPLKGELIFTAVVCEEYPGENNKGTVKLIRDGFQADMVLVGEPTRMEICRGCQGMTEVLIRTKGKPIHACTAESGVNAINAMVKIINKINEELKPGYSELLGSGSINVGVIQGGNRSSSVPESCWLKVSKFVVEGESGKQFQDQIDAIIERLKAEDPTLDAKTELTYSSFAGVIPEEHPLTQHLKNATRKVFGQEKPVDAVRCHLDSDFLINMVGIPCITYGPGDILLAHKENEWVDVADVPDAAKVYVEAILDAMR